jgi:hypothetical protein
MCGPEISELQKFNLHGLFIARIQTSAERLVKVLASWKIHKQTWKGKSNRQLKKRKMNSKLATVNARLSL